MAKTFSDADVIRIFCKHLDLKEQITVMFVMVFIMPDLVFDKVTENAFPKFAALISLMRRAVVIRVIIQRTREIIDTLLPPNIVRILKDCFEVHGARTARAQLVFEEEETLRMIKRACNTVLDVLQGIGKLHNVKVPDINVFYQGDLNDLWSVKFHIRAPLENILVRSVNLSPDFNLNSIAVLRGCVNQRVLAFSGK